MAMDPHPPSPSPQGREAVAFQKAAVARLKREIVGVDRNNRRRYIREFHDEFRSFLAVSSRDDLIIDCYKADIIYLGDYHALPASQRFASEMLAEIATRAQETILCLEMVYGRDQANLDRYMSGGISEAEFVKAIRYQAEWGYDWASFRPLFETARAHAVSVFGVDSGPRTGFRHIRQRDAYAAARIADLAARHPNARIVVVIGESHLARNHLPRKVTDHLKGQGLEKRGVIVLQNLEEVYWQLAERGLEQVDVVSLGPGRYCCFNTSPLAKYEAYRRTLEVWKGEEEDESQVDLTSTVHGMIDAILKFLRVDKYSHRLRRRAGGGEFMVDVYPEIYSGIDEKDLRRLLKTHQFSPEEMDQVAGHLDRSGSCYIPRINAIFIGRLNMVHAGEEAAHFVNLALKGEIYDDAPREMPQHDLFYSGVLEEALGCFGSKLIDPSRIHFFETEFYQYYRKERAEIEANTPYSYEDFNAIIHFILLHKTFEQNYARYQEVPPEILEGIRAAPRRANILIHELGYFLGQQLYDAYKAGTLDRREIARLFRLSFRASGSALQTYLDLTERVGSPAPEAPPAQTAPSAEPGGRAQG